MATTQSTDTLPSSVPKLDPSGVNWPIFAERFQEAVASKKLWGHFSGSVTRPQPAGTTPTDDEKEKAQKWDDDEATARYLLSQKLPDSALMKIRRYGTVAERWAAIQLDFTSKGMFAQTDL
ncbi:hypothetical protein GLOTRDRAFT_34064, partial [Gloeophyllum trabeum ATCC 11539]